MFVVFGANGNTGKVVASTLLDRGAKVRVVARDASKVAALTARGAEFFQGDVLDPSSVRAALAGASGAYLLVPPDAASTDLVGRGRRIVDGYLNALQHSPVAHAVVLSSVGAQAPAGTGPIVITHYAEATLPRATATTFTFVRAAYFMENLLSNVHPMKADGVLPVFGGGESYAFPMIATRDIGTVSAEALLAPPQAHAWIELSGPREYSYADAAAIASKHLGRPVKPLVLPIEAMVPTLQRFGISENVAGLYREMTEGSATGLVSFEGRGRAVRGVVPLEDVLLPALG